MDGRIHMLFRECRYKRYMIPHVTLHGAETCSRLEQDIEAPTTRLLPKSHPNRICNEGCNGALRVEGMKLNPEL